MGASPEYRIQAEIVAYLRLVAPEGIPDLLIRWGTKLRINDSTGCWEWTGGKKAKGYGVMALKDPKRFAMPHRVIMDHLGHDIEGKYVCHRCDNPSCCNPAHLFVGTPQDNINDAIAKGRAVNPPPRDWTATVAAGRHHWQKLTTAQVNEAKALRSRGVSATVVAALFEVSPQHIYKITKGERRRHA